MSKAEAELEMQLKALKIPYEREHRFHPTRRWRIDFALRNEETGANIAVEIEGIKYSGKSRHQTGAGFQGDLDKYEEAMRLGWTVYRCSPAMVTSGRALQTIEILLKRSREARQ